MSIPRIIHYCWFGGNPLPENAKKCIASWKKYLPDYEIKEWNESNFDLNCCRYIREAYEAKKWAFVSDYARFDILYRFGGLYFDTDVEIIKDISDIIEAGPFMGSEPDGDGKCRVAAGLGLAAVPGQKIYKDILDHYSKLQFKISDGVYNDTTIVTYITNVLQPYGYKGNCTVETVSDLTIYPPEYFCPMDMDTGELSITPNTRSIHWYTASWKDATEIQIHNRAIAIYNKIPNNFGRTVGKVYENAAKAFYYMQKEGIRSVCRRISRKSRK